MVVCFFVYIECNRFSMFSSFIHSFNDCYPSQIVHLHPLHKTVLENPITSLMTPGSAKINWRAVIQKVNTGNTWFRKYLDSLKMGNTCSNRQKDFYPVNICQCCLPSIWNCEIFLKSENLQLFFLVFLYEEYDRFSMFLPFIHSLTVTKAR